MTGPVPEVRWSGRHAVLTMPTEIDLGNSAAVGELLSAIVGQSPDVISADMTATEYCDSAGIHAVARAHERAVASDVELRLVIGHSPVARILQLTGLDQVVPVYPDVQQSLANPPNRPDSRRAEVRVAAAAARTGGSPTGQAHTYPERGASWPGPHLQQIAYFVDDSQSVAA